MNYVGISAGFHDAAISLIDNNGEILYAGHGERYNKLKHSKQLSLDIVQDAMSYTNSNNIEVHYYEQPLLKYLRQLWSGETTLLKNLFAKNIISDELLKIIFINKAVKIYTHNHHLSHAAAGFQTSSFDQATVVIIDAIGEFDTITIWNAWYENGYAKYKKIFNKKYPHSVGLFYSAMTKRVGLKPLDEEYILMGMSAYGEPKYDKEMLNLFRDFNKLELKHNLHIGVDDDFLSGVNHMDIARSTQNITESIISLIMSKAKWIGASKNLVYGGGVALNCLANRNLGNFFDKIWIMPNPGDAGSSLGAAALGYGKKLNWKNAFLGYDIKGKYPANLLLDELIKNKIVGVANGRAEFGPRALGNRSLFADPRGNKIKDKVNEIKRRQKFRPFAPVILEEYVDDYFLMPKGFSKSPYMQVVAQCKNPELFPAIVHVDGTSRVQTIGKDSTGIRQLLEKWYVLTGCPMLLNTSLNIRGEPMVNDRIDADRFEKLYGVKVYS